VVTLSLITDAFIPRTEALALLESALGMHALGGNLAEKHFVLGDDARLSIEIPKFGEDLPLTLDFSGTNAAVLREHAMAVSASVKESLGWACQLHEWETIDE
jgi:hypothetical protein